MHKSVTDACGSSTGSHELRSDALLGMAGGELLGLKTGDWQNKKRPHEFYKNAFPPNSAFSPPISAFSPPISAFVLGPHFQKKAFRIQVPQNSRHWDPAMKRSKSFIPLPVASPTVPCRPLWPAATKQHPSLPGKALALSKCSIFQDDPFVLFGDSNQGAASQIRHNLLQASFGPPGAAVLSKDLNQWPRCIHLPGEVSARSIRAILE